MNNTQPRRVAGSHNPEPKSIPTARVIEGIEKIDDWLGHREIVIQELCPVGALETIYAQRAALYLWRLKRVIGYENAATHGEIEARSEIRREDSPEARMNRLLPDQSKHQTIIKYEAHLVRCLASTMAELRRLQKERSQGLRDSNPESRGADRAGVCQKDFYTKGSHGGSPSRKSSHTQSITRPEMSIPGGRGADRAGASKKELIEKGSHGGSPSRQITCPDDSIPGGRGAARAGGCQNQQIKDGSPGGSPSHKSSPSLQITNPEMSISVGRGADRAGVCQHQQIQDGSPGGSHSQIGSPSQKSSPSQFGSQSQSGSPCQTGSTSHVIAAPEKLIPGGRGADRAGGCQHQQIKAGSPGGSPSQIGSPVKFGLLSQESSSISQIAGAEMSIPLGRGADRAGGGLHELDEKGSHGGSPSRKITNPEMSIPGGRGADRAGVCQNQQLKDGSPRASPSQKSSPSRQITRPEKSIPGGSSRGELGLIGGRWESIVD